MEKLTFKKQYLFCGKEAKKCESQSTLSSFQTPKNINVKQPDCQLTRISLTIPELKSLNFIKGIGQLSEENRRINNEVF